MSSFLHVNHLRDVTGRQPTFVAIGSFDGIHHGHQALLRRMVAAAKAVGGRTAVLTFFPHPKRILHNLKGRYYLTTLADRVRLIAEQGIDIIITQPFDEEVRTTRAADFVQQLQDHLQMVQLWGGDFALGHQREGTIDFLQQLGQKRGYTVEQVNEMVVQNGAIVSSSRTRQSLAAGDMVDVAACLGRPYHLDGTVVLGDQRGRTIGFPTANIAVWDELLLPAYGVYATTIRHGQQRYLAATNVGVRPTINGGDVTVEAHLLDFSGDLYGESLHLEFGQRVRPEMKFSGLDALQAQIQADVATVRSLLA